jgi:cell division protein ZapD
MKKIVYEHPLSERIRSLLRLEHLFAGILYRLKGPAEWDSRAVINILIEILDFINRFDFKIELIKELEFHAETLERWQRTPNVDTERLVHLLNKTKTLRDKLGLKEPPLSTRFSQHYLIHSVRQRRTISGGMCQCDLPSLYYWLQKSPKIRQNELNEWITFLTPLREATDFLLYLIRNNAQTAQVVAVGGFYQSQLDADANYRMIQITIPSEHSCYPEVKGGKRRFSVRFFEFPVADIQPCQTEHDVHFELGCCMA